jgi:hypothetical protein
MRRSVLLFSTCGSSDSQEPEADDEDIVPHTAATTLAHWPHSCSFICRHQQSFVLCREQRLSPSAIPHQYDDTCSPANSWTSPTVWTSLLRAGRGRLRDVPHWRSSEPGSWQVRRGHGHERPQRATASGHVGLRCRLTQAPGSWQAHLAARSETLPGSSVVLLKAHEKTHKHQLVT